MNKLFYFLLFCSVTGAGVLWWLMNTITQEEVVQEIVVDKDKLGLQIQDTPDEVHEKDKAKEADEAVKEDTMPSEELAKPNDETKETVDNAKTTDKNDNSLNSLFQGEAKPSQLNISSEPMGVDVFLNSQKIGVTPIERTLTNKVQKFRFEKPGFVPVEREAHAEKTPEGAYLSWRINMVPLQNPTTQKPQVSSSESHFLQGVSGPFFVQVKAYSTEEENRNGLMLILDEMRTTIKEQKVFACEVSLGDRGRWYRVLIGPFASRQEAQKSLSFLKESLKINDLFVTGVQSCL